MQVENKTHKIVLNIYYYSDNMNSNKKHALSFLLVALWFGLRAQTPDTIMDLDPTYFHWHCWDDSAYRSQHEPYYSGLSVIFDSYYEVAFENRTDRPLKVIGVAGCFDTTFIYRIDNCCGYYVPGPGTVEDTHWSSRVPETYRLYASKSKSPTDLSVLAQVDYNITPRASRYLYYEINGRNILDSIFYAPVYEAYFDSAVVVEGEFYVGTTLRNNHKLARWGENDHELSWSYYPVIPTQLFWSQRGDSIRTYMPRDCNYAHKQTDTSDWYFWPLSQEITYMVFPIIDTTYSPLDPQDIETCMAPHGLIQTSNAVTMAQLAWSPAPMNQHYELEYWLEENPSDTTLVAVNDTSTMLFDLTPSVWYNAHVRGECYHECWAHDTLVWSEWGEILRFYVGEKPLQDTNESISKLVDRHTSLSPNPTKDRIVVTSSFGVRMVDIYASDGSLVMSRKTEGHATDLCLGNLPNGTYVVKIETEKGTATRKVIIDK